MAKGDKVIIDGQEYTTVWSTEEMTEEERLESAKRAAELMMAFGIEPISPEIRKGAGLPSMSTDALMQKELDEFHASDRDTPNPIV